MTSARDFYLFHLSEIIYLNTFSEFLSFVHVNSKLSILSNQIKHLKELALYFMLLLFPKIFILTNHHYFIKYNCYYFKLIIIVLKYYYNYLKVIKKAFISLFQKRKFKASLFFISNQYKINDNKLNIINISNIEDDFWI